MVKSPKIILRYVIGLVGVFGVGFVLLVGLHFSFMELLARFDRDLENERARIAIGEVIIANVNQIERNYYQLATTSASSRSVELIYAKSQGFFAHIEQAFTVFKNGGSLTVTTRLNEEGLQDFSRTITYVPSENDVLEIIDIRPKVQEVKERMQTIAYLVAKRNSLIRSGDQAGLPAVREEIVIFFKKSSAHFVRLHENANRLYYQGHKNLERLQGEISRRKSYYTRVAVGVSVAIISGVLVICWLIARQIYAAHSQLDFVSKEMEKAKRQADAANKIKADFLATMSHEVRTPMNIIVGMTGLALETQLTPTQQRYLTRIQSAAEVLLGLLDDILDFSKIEEGQLELADQPFDLKELVSAVVEVVKMEARKKGIALVAHVAETAWAPKGDPARMRQILLILISNAVKFTAKGQVVIEARLEELDPDRLLAVITVQDTGVGIAKEQLSSIFDIFAQGDASVTRKYGGAGLGLAISNQLATLMGGEITVESKVGQGSIFTLSLPMLKASSCPIHRGSAGGRKGARPVRNLDVLLVDGDGDQREIAQALLEKAGHRVKGAANGLEGLRCLAKFQYDIVFLALHMPVLDGRETALDIRAFERGDALERAELGYDIDWLAARLHGQHTLLVAVSDQPQHRNQAVGLDPLFDDHICKPYTTDALGQSVYRLTGLGQGLRDKL